MSDADVRRPVPAWLWGGGLLAASAALPLLGRELSATVAMSWICGLLAASAYLVFALGIRREGSVVARRRVGVVALIVLGVAPLLFDLFTPVVALPVTPMGLPENLLLLQVLWYGQLVVWSAAALVAVVEIARARVVPDPWRWAPTWGLALVAGLFLITQVYAVAVGARGRTDVAVLLSLGVAAVTGFVPLALGILAMVLGARGRAAAPAQVYPPLV